MAGNVFFFTSGDSPNWDKTIARPIDVDTVASILPGPEAEQLRSKSIGEIFAWGAPEGAVGTIAGMSEDDVVFGARRGTVGFGGLVLLSPKEPQPKVSELLWGAATWPYVYFLHKAAFAFRPVPEFLMEMGERGKIIMGFRVSHGASRLLRSVGSPDEFIRLALGIRASEPGRPIKQEPEPLVELPEPRNHVDDLGHSEAQADLIRIGEALGLSVWVAANDRSQVVRDYVFKSHTLAVLPFEGQPQFHRQIELIDVLWLRGSAIVAAFEVEHSTGIYSGLIRLNDLALQFPNLSFPLFVVAPDADRKRVCTRMGRPTFQHLRENCRYIPYSRLRDAVLEISRFGRKLDYSVIEDYSDRCNGGVPD